jgi:DNA polymerase (family 10)
MTRLSTSQVRNLLDEFGKRYALAGGDPYRARAYSRAADALGTVTEPIAKLIAEDRLQDIPGVGQAIAGVIETLHRTGTHPRLERLRADVPASVLEMLSIPGLRADKVRRLAGDLGITNVKQLEEAAREGRLRKAKGLGASVERIVLQGLEMRAQGGGARHLHKAEALVARAANNLRRANPSLTRITPAGSIRRGNELVTDMAIVAEAPALQSGPEVAKEGELAVHLTDEKHFGASLLDATGSPQHLEELRAIAKEKGFVLKADGLYHGERLAAGKSEEDIYQALGLSFIPPELREGRGEIALARVGQLPKLVEQTDIRGILHAHTTDSDGNASLEEMAEAARERGYEYFGVADHSRSAHYAGGLSIDKLLVQGEEAQRLNARYHGRFRIFRGTESDILADGSLDYPDEVLAGLDFVVASIHGQFRMNKEAQTERLVRAAANPFTTIIGHMTGRLLLRRKGYDVDVEKVLAACAAHDVAIEINANPWRLDLDWRWHGKALEFGCRFSINPDAHSVSELDLVRWGIAQARKGGIPKERVLNCLSRKQLEVFFKGRAGKRLRRF